MTKLLYLTSRLFNKVTRYARCKYWSCFFSAKRLHISSNVRLEGYEQGAIHLGDDIHIGRFAWIQAVTRFQQQTFTPRLTIGSGVKMSEFVHIGCALQVTIGDHCLLASKTLIIDHHHGGTSAVDLLSPPAQRELICAPVIIGRNVFLGDNVVVLPGVTIGDNTIVGANSVVAVSLPANCVAVGSPAKVIKVISCE